MLIEAVLLKAAAPWALKAIFLAKMAGLKAYLATVIGSSAAGVTTSLLAGACATIFIETRIKRNSDQAAIDKAVAEGVSEDVATAIIDWLNENIRLS